MKKKIIIDTILINKDNFFKFKLTAKRLFLSSSLSVDTAGCTDTAVREKKRAQQTEEWVAHSDSPVDQ